jgi:hypothetical protein
MEMRIAKDSFFMLPPYSERWIALLQLAAEDVLLDFD